MWRQKWHVRDKMNLDVFRVQYAIFIVTCKLTVHLCRFDDVINLIFKGPLFKVPLKLNENRLSRDVMTPHVTVTSGSSVILPSILPKG